MLCNSTRLVSFTAQLAQVLIGALQVAQEAAAPHAAVASSPAGASSKRAEPNAELLLEKLREHIFEKGARLPACRAACREHLSCVLFGASLVAAIQLARCPQLVKVLRGLAP